MALCEWASIKYWQVQIYMFPYPTKKVHDISITINSNPLKQVWELKYFGVMTDDNINWKAHVSYISSKITRSIGIIKAQALCQPGINFTILFINLSILNIWYNFLGTYMQNHFYTISKYAKESNKTLLSHTI